MTDPAPAPAPNTPAALATNLFHQSLEARKGGRLDVSARLLRAGLKLDPGMAGLWYNLSGDLHAAGQYEAAVAALHCVLELQPNEPHALANIGCNLYFMARHAESVAYARRAVVAKPDLALSWSNLSLSLSAMGHDAEAVDAAREAVRHDGANAAFHMVLAFALMKMGRYDEGLREYEWRFPFKMPEFLHYTLPRWDGGPCKHLFIPAEQGFGDTIQFARFVSLAVERCDRVTVGVQEELIDALDLPGARKVPIPCGMPEGATAFVPMMSLPLALGITEANVAEVPPICVYTDVWEHCPPGRKHVGIVWAGSGDHENDRHRSASLRDMLGLAAIPGVTLHSLQVGRDYETKAYDPLIVDRTRKLDDFADTANYISGLDAVVAVDTAVAHLSASMGVPTHLLLPAHGRHFCWGARDATRTPWYPSMRLHTQPRPGDWTSVITEVVEELSR
jgi:Flp pilus assembly protein TadD